MKSTLLAIALALALQAFAALAADEPEAVYAKYHRAVLDGKADEMLRYATDAQRAQMEARSEAQNASQLKAMAKPMPPSFELRAKIVSPDGQTARLWLTGPGKPLADGKAEPLYALAFLMLQHLEWKVAAAGWSNRDPGLPDMASVPKPYAPAARQAAPQKAGLPERPVSQAPSTRPVGALDSGPERKLGKQKPPCEFKPVMTAEDLENCK
jgi:hypothetical protein